MDRRTAWRVSLTVVGGCFPAFIWALLDLFGPAAVVVFVLGVVGAWGVWSWPGWEN